MPRIRLNVKKGGKRAFITLWPHVTEAGGVPMLKVSPLVISILTQR